MTSLGVVSGIIAVISIYVGLFLLFIHIGVGIAYAVINHEPNNVLTYT
jgi:hypothetical protein